MGFFLLNVVLLLIIIFLFAMLSWIWPPDSPWSFWWTTSKKISRRLCALAKVKKGDVFYELGSGEGTTVLIAAKEYGARCIGVEIDPMRAFISQLRIRLMRQEKKIQVVRGNFFAVDLSPATVVYAYLIPKALLRLKKKLLTELAPGTRVISYKYTIPYLPQISIDKKAEIYVYKIPKRISRKKV